MSKGNGKSITTTVKIKVILGTGKPNFERDEAKSCVDRRAGNLSNLSRVDNLLNLQKQGIGASLSTNESLDSILFRKLGQLFSLGSAGTKRPFDIDVLLS